MSYLKPGTQCVIVAGCSENIGVIVEVIGRVYSNRPADEAYRVKTASGRPFHQLWDGNDLLRGDSDQAITDRFKLRPLVFPKDDCQTAEVPASPIKTYEQSEKVEASL